MTCSWQKPRVGGLRDEAVWIGGTPYSPHGASFVPPHASRVPDYINDLIEFGVREDVLRGQRSDFPRAVRDNPPFTDGNGRTGRALVHRMLANDEV